MPQNPTGEMELRAALKEALVRELNLQDVTPGDIADDEPLFGDEGLGLDSLDAVELVVLVKRNFGITMQDAEEARRAFASVAVLADYIDTRLAGHAPS